MARRKITSTSTGDGGDGEGGGTFGSGTTYLYPTSGTANGKVSPVALQNEIVAAGLATDGVVVQDATFVGNGCYEGGEINVLFSAPLSDPDKAKLDATVAAHKGKVVLSATFIVTAEVVHDEVALSPTWADLGGVVTSIDYFVPDLATAVARVVGAYKASGAGAQIRIVVGLPGTDEPMSAVLDLPDTGGAWAFIPTFNSNTPPPAGKAMYRLQGQLNGAASASVQYTSMSLLETD
jgi:hypothetical protein